VTRADAIARIAVLASETLTAELDAVVAEDGAALAPRVRRWLLDTMARDIRAAASHEPRLHELAEMSDADIRAAVLQRVDVRAALAVMRPAAVSADDKSARRVAMLRGGL